MIKAIIIDDEKHGAEVLQFLVKQNCADVQILSMEHSVEKAINSIRKYKPDLIFLDIRMPTGTGFDIIAATNDISYETIFITAYENYAVKAFKTNAVDYLLKPIDIDELVSAVNNARKRIEANDRNKIHDDIPMTVNENLKNKKISIPTQKGTLWVDLTDIVRFEAESNYTHVYMKRRSRLMVAKTLKSFEDQLHDTVFCRVHSAHLINLNEVERYIKGDGGMVVLKDASIVPVSRANKTGLLGKLNLYL